MRKDVHRAALAAAGRVAFSVAFLTGCSAENPDQGNDAPADEADYTKRADAAACGDKKFSCDDLLEAAFPGPDKYPGQKQNVSAAVAGCCDEELAAKPFGSAHRWACAARTHRRMRARASRWPARRGDRRCRPR